MVFTSTWRDIYLAKVFFFTAADKPEHAMKKKKVANSGGSVIPEMTESSGGEARVLEAKNIKKK